MALRWSSCMSRRIVSTFLGVELMEGRPDLSSSLSEVLSILKCACHSKHLVRLVASFQYAHCLISKVSAPDLPSFTNNLMFALCSSFTSCWNRKCEGTRGDKHWCCATPNVHTATPLDILSGDVPCSQAQRTHSRTAIGWRSMEIVSKLFDAPTYFRFSLSRQYINFIICMLLTSTEHLSIVYSSHQFLSKSLFNLSRTVKLVNHVTN
jgi:hypothetical protein